MRDIKQRESVGGLRKRFQGYLDEWLKEGVRPSAGILLRGGSNLQGGEEVGEDWGAELKCIGCIGLNFLLGEKTN